MASWRVRGLFASQHVYPLPSGWLQLRLHFSTSLSLKGSTNFLVRARVIIFFLFSHRQPPTTTKNDQNDPKLNEASGSYFGTPSSANTVTTDMDPKVIMYQLTVLLFLVPLFTLPIQVAILVGLISWYLVPLCQNIQLARRSGLKYVVVPYHTYNFVWTWFISKRCLQAFYSCLDKCVAPSTSITARRQFLDSLWPLRLRNAPFTELGTDTFMIVSPGGIIVNTIDADVIKEIIDRPYDFPKPTYIYQFIAIFGQNVVSSGDASKLNTPPFHLLHHMCQDLQRT